MQYKSNIFLPISLQIIIRGPNGGLILVIVGAQGGKNKEITKSQSSLIN